jgi:uncharacterized membrane protein YfcA
MSAEDQSPKRPLIGFGFSVPIALAGGLIGLGGAEFRLPVLKGPMGYSAKQAVPLNLSVSIITLAVSFITRASAFPLAPLAPLEPVMTALIAGAVVTAFLGTGLLRHLSNERLERVILVFLVAIGAALIVESFLPQSGLGVVSVTIIPAVVATGVLFGLLIGLVSSMLGVAGGELIIPTLIFVYGVDVKIAGTASLLVSLPTVAVGLVRYARQGSFSQRSFFGETIVPMGAGSVIGALFGGLLLGVVQSWLLKLILGTILIISAVRIFSSKAPNHPP